MDYRTATADERRCGSISPESRKRCLLAWSDPHVGGHVVRLSDTGMAGWWYGTVEDKCERAPRFVDQFREWS